MTPIGAARALILTACGVMILPCCRAFSLGSIATSLTDTTVSSRHNFFRSGSRQRFPCAGATMGRKPGRTVRECTASSSSTSSSSSSPEPASSSSSSLPQKQAAEGGGEPAPVGSPTKRELPAEQAEPPRQQPWWETERRTEGVPTLTRSTQWRMFLSLKVGGTGV